VAYKEAHGHCNVPQSSGPLGTRCGNLRVSRKNGTLSPEKIAQLDALGFCWQFSVPKRTEIEDGIFPSRFGEPRRGG
jgi:Helicase associated domain